MTEGSGSASDVPAATAVSSDAEQDAAVSQEPKARGAGLSGTDLLVREGDLAGDYLERLLDILDVDGDIDLDVEGDRAVVAVVGARLDRLVGPDGGTLEALQELTRLAVVQATGVRSRLMLDIGGYRAARRAELTSVGLRAAEQVVAGAPRVELAPMSPFERKVIHDAVSGVEGAASESEGVEPNRYVVVLPA